MHRPVVVQARIALLILVAGGCAGPNPTLEPVRSSEAIPTASPTTRATTASPTEQPGFTIDAGVTVRGSLVDRDDGACRSTGRYRDIASGATVVVTDTGTGEELARGTLRDEHAPGPGMTAAAHLECWFRFTLTGVPEAPGYAFDIAGTSRFEYAAAELHDVLGFLHFTMGGPAIDRPIRGLVADDVERALGLECRDRTTAFLTSVWMRDCSAVREGVTMALLLTSLPTGELVAVEAVAAGVLDEARRAAARDFLRSVAELPWDDADPAEAAAWVVGNLELGGAADLGTVGMAIPRDPPPGVLGLFVEGLP